MAETELRAIIVDLDGVVTRTAAVHARAWKAMFDDFLQAYAEHSGLPQDPFSIEHDYPAYVDGKPRYQGVEDFLRSRQIELPRGTPEDPPDAWTVAGLGNRKNALFRELVAKEGVEVYASSVAKIEELRGLGLRTGLVSSSKNTRPILATTGLDELFEVVVDGRDAEAAGLAGKPHPDTYLEAARQLGCAPEEAAVVEDALVGVEAGRRGGFGLVIGVDRANQADALRAHGADQVVQDLAQIPAQRFKRAGTPSALARFDTLARWLDRRAPALFLDYDGTLTGIVNDPAAANMDPQVRERLAALAERCLLAIVSGRDLQDVRARVGLEALYYAGSHGYDIAGPGGTRSQLEKGKAYLPAIDAVEQELHAALDAVPGALLERKRFTLAVHYRNSAEQDVPRVEAAVDAAVSRHGLRKGAGKKVFELQPPIDWDKGKAVRWLMEALEVDPNRTPPIYIGDDLTDEDAFAALTDDGLGILVAEIPRQSAARYSLVDPGEVKAFLDRLHDLLTPSRAA